MSKYDPTVPFQSIENAARITGLSRYHLRNGCRDGSVPHVKCGNTYKINVPALLELYGQKSKQSAPA